jgi:hypothetical protein
MLFISAVFFSAGTSEMFWDQLFTTIEEIFATAK